MLSQPRSTSTSLSRERSSSYFQLLAHLAVHWAREDCAYEDPARPAERAFQLNSHAPVALCARGEAAFSWYSIQLLLSHAFPS
jgi:hypothetical protein